MLDNHNTTSNSFSSYGNAASGDTFMEMTEYDQTASRPVPELASLGISPDLINHRFKEALDYVCDHIDKYTSSPGIDFTRRSKFDPITAHEIFDSHRLRLFHM